jgi:preprotein translocase subunit SecD
VPPAKRPAPTRALLLVFVVLAALYGGMALGGTYSPALGLDLKGGTTVTLTAKPAPGQKVSRGDMNTAVNIMRNRVNGLGVSSASVQVEGTSNIVVSVPGKDTQGALDSIATTALLSIRQVYETNEPGATGTDVPDTSATTPSVTTSPAPTATPAPSSSSSPSAGTTPAPSGSGSPKALGGADGGTAPHAQDAGYVRAASTPASPAASSAGSPAPSASASPSTGSTGSSGSAAVETAPTAAEVAAYAKLDCNNPANQKGDATRDDPNKFIVTCGHIDGSTVWFKYLLHPTLIPGKEISSASSQLDPQTGASWDVLLTFKSKAQNTWAKFTAGHVGTLTAIVLDGNVISSETIQGAITGTTQITGNFTHKTASRLADDLKYGALPLSFETQTAQTISPTLGSTELHAGLLAGGIGLILVLLYSFFYYRGLSLVTVTSLALSAAIQYPILVLLGKGINYTLTLAGIAGLIVAVGVTADSFVVFFERLRDEVREGNTLRQAVEKGWVRARRTIVSADLVSLIAAAILYWLAIGDVRGFAFTLGLSTIVDLFIVFFFTKPLITLLGRTRFYGNGHPLSGLDPGRLGVAKLKGIGTTVTRRAAPARKV